MKNYQIIIKFCHWNEIILSNHFAQVGNPAKNILWPMELVKLKKQPCPRSKELTGQQTAKMIK